MQSKWHRWDLRKPLRRAKGSTRSPKTDFRQLAPQMKLKSSKTDPEIWNLSQMKNGKLRFFVHETASSSEFCWLLLVMLVPMAPASFCI